MPKPYSQDLRDRVIDADREEVETSRREAARRYEISESVAVKWLERLERKAPESRLATGGHRASSARPIRNLSRRRGPRNRTSRFRRFAIAFRLSDGSKLTLR